MRTIRSDKRFGFYCHRMGTKFPYFTRYDILIRMVITDVEARLGLMKKGEDGMVVSGSHLSRWPSGPIEVVTKSHSTGFLFF